jgi:hypothetical protein
MKIVKALRKYAQKLGTAEEGVLKTGKEEIPRNFVEKSAEGYVKA